MSPARILISWTIAAALGFRMRGIEIGGSVSELAVVLAAGIVATSLAYLIYPIRTPKHYDEALPPHRKDPP